MFPYHVDDPCVFETKKTIAEYFMLVGFQLFV